MASPGETGAGEVLESRPMVSGTKVAGRLNALQREVTECAACPRLVAWRERAAAEPPRRFQADHYWARPVPGFGDPSASIAIVGLAPAANGANRTGRMFTGDRSGDWLYAALHRAGLANQAGSTGRDDGLALRDVWITAVVRCAPPTNKPLPTERDACLPYLARELPLLPNLRVVMALGGFAWNGVLAALALSGSFTPRPKPRFGHGAETVAGALPMLGCYHPSQQNTFTGRLTAEMLDSVLTRAKTLARIT